MYESFFRFTSRPFVAAPLVSSFFASESAETSRQALTRSIDRAEGPGLIIGPAGVGKTLLCRMLAARFQDTFQVAMLSSTRILTRKALLQNILFELGLPYRGMEEGELRLSLLDHLQPDEDCPNGILLLVDEAHSLSLRLLEEIRMITNLVRDGQPRVRLVMAGGAKLEEKFANPKLESFNQRIAARCYLEPFGRDDTIEYVLSRLAAAGGNRDADAIFDEGALRAIYHATDGIPRLINQVCDHALVMAFAGGRQRIDAAGIQEAWADLQQLPGPWHDSVTAETTGTTIEFGELDAEPTEADFGGEPLTETSPILSLESESDFGSMTDEPLSECTTDGVEAAPVAAETQAPVSDPFGDGFDEEEVVIDQAVIQSAEIFANRTRVESREGRELVASMPPREDQAIDSFPASELVTDRGTASPDYAADTIESELGVDEPVSAPISASVASDEEQQVSPVGGQSHAEHGAQMFEYTAFEPNNVADLALQALCDVNIAFGDLDDCVSEEGVSEEGVSEEGAREEATAEKRAPVEETAEEKPTVRLLDYPAAAAAEADDTPVNDDRAIILVENDEPTRSPGVHEGSVHRVEYQTLFSQLRHG